MERDKQGIVVQKQTKLRQIKVNILYAINAALLINVRIIRSISILQQEQVLNVQRVLGGVIGLGSIIVARFGRVFNAGSWPQVLVDVDIDTTYRKHFRNCTIKKFVIVRLYRTPHT